jgi:hypothetical protein
MTPTEQNKIDTELKSFTSRHFERPAACRNVEQVRFYVRELCVRIEELEEQFNYAPEWAYGLLAQYSARQDAMISDRNMYS